MVRPILYWECTAHMRVPWRKTTGLIAIVVFLIALRFYSTRAPHESLAIQRPLMGTTWNIQVMDHGHPEQARQAIEQAYRELERIDALMS